MSTTLASTRAAVAPAPDLSAFSTDALLAQLQLRGAFAQICGAAGALYDQCDRVGLLTSDDRLTAYLLYRLRREVDAIALVGDDRDDSRKFWEGKIASIEPNAPAQGDPTAPAAAGVVTLPGSTGLSGTASDAHLRDAP